MPGDFSWITGSNATLRNTGTRLNAPDPASGKRGLDPLYVGGFRSRHVGGANFAFGDGSVRFIRETIDAGVYRLLGHRADGELIDDRTF